MRRVSQGGPSLCFSKNRPCCPSKRKIHKNNQNTSVETERHKRSVIWNPWTIAKPAKHGNNVFLDCLKKKIDALPSLGQHWPPHSGQTLQGGPFIKKKKRSLSLRDHPKLSCWRPGRFPQKINGPRGGGWQAICRIQKNTLFPERVCERGRTNF